MQAVQDFTGYNPRALPFAVYVLLALLTGGLLWILGQLFPRSILWTMAKCPLSHAQYVQAKVCLQHDLAGPRLHHRANPCLGLQLITGQSKVVKVHTHHVEPMSNNMFQVRSVLQRRTVPLIWPNSSNSSSKLCLQHMTQMTKGQAHPADCQQKGHGHVCPENHHSSAGCVCL